MLIPNIIFYFSGTYFCRMKLVRWSLILLAFFTISCNGEGEGEGTPADTKPPVPIKTWTPLSSIPHDTSYFTQGYEFYKGDLLIGTGNYGHSRLLKVQPLTGRILKQVNLDPKQFGEGITVLNDTVYQLTWKEHVVNIYSAKDLVKLREATLNTEGWGAANDGKHILVTDGSNLVYFYDPKNFQLVKKIEVTESGLPAVNLNELEYVDGFIYANQWQYHYILKIDAATGNVIAKYDLSDLVKKVETEFPFLDVRNNAVLNGIAYNKETKKFYITGKLWPLSYEVDLVP
jgi:glutaminyl-peptide cyclotransferase